MESFRESVWAAVPDEAVPERAVARMRFVREQVRAGDRVLDLGCGDGAFAAALDAAGAHVVAVDVAEGAVGRARAAAPAAVTVLKVEEDAALPFAEDAFDVVWAGEVLEHAVDTALLLAEVRRVLRFGGVLVLTTPNHGRLRTAALALRGRAFDAHFDPRADHLRFYTARTLAEVLHDAGFVTATVDAVDGPPLWRRALHAVAR